MDLSRTRTRTIKSACCSCGATIRASRSTIPRDGPRQPTHWCWPESGRNSKPTSRLAATRSSHVTNKFTTLRRRKKAPKHRWSQSLAMRLQQTSMLSKAGCPDARSKLQRRLRSNQKVRDSRATSRRSHANRATDAEVITDAETRARPKTRTATIARRKVTTQPFAVRSNVKSMTWPTSTPKTTTTATR